MLLTKKEFYLIWKINIKAIEKEFGYLDSIS